MRGTYRFYQNGQLVGESENLITDAGKRHILRYLAGQEATLAGSIAVGAGSSEPLGTDTRLTYEFNRSTIYLTSPSYIDKKIIFKSTLQREIVGNIYEIGLFSTEYSGAARTLASFEQDVESWAVPTGVSFRSDFSRIGAQSLRLATAASTTLSSTLAAPFDLSAYANSDRVVAGFYVFNNNIASVSFRLRQSTTDYFESVVTAPMQGYNTRSFPKSTFTRVGNPDWANIASLAVTITAKNTGSTEVHFDGLRIEGFTADINNILISRSLLTTPVVKAAEEMDVEYTLEVPI